MFLHVVSERKGILLISTKKHSSNKSNPNSYLLLNYWSLRVVDTTYDVRADLGRFL